MRENRNTCSDGWTQCTTALPAEKTLRVADVVLLRCVQLI